MCSDHQRTWRCPTERYVLHTYLSAWKVILNASARAQPFHISRTHNIDMHNIYKWLSPGAWADPVDRFRGRGKFWQNGPTPNLPPFSNFVADLGHFILKLLNFVIFMFIFYIYLVVLERPKHSERWGHGLVAAGSAYGLVVLIGSWMTDHIVCLNIASSQIKSHNNQLTWSNSVYTYTYLCAERMVSVPIRQRLI